MYPKILQKINQKTLGVVHKLRLQEESQNINFYKVKNVNKGEGVGIGCQKSQKLVNVVCEQPLSMYMDMYS